VLFLTYAHVFQALCRNATNAIKINHIPMPKITLLYIKFTPCYLPTFLKSSLCLNQYESIKIEQKQIICRIFRFVISGNLMNFPD